MKALDLTNQVFGKLRALTRAPRRNDRYTRWICQCECGNQTEVRTDYLRSGHTTSCGCEKAIHFTAPKIEPKTRFGKLQVNYYDNLQNMYFCQCDCGNTTFVKGYNLINGNTQSCGCLKSKGELKINELLNTMDIKFHTQHTFDDCRFPDTNRLAHFDYAIFDNDILIGLIEYDGSQHEIGWNEQEKSLRIIKARDKYKEYYCLTHNIPLIRIPYTDYDKLTISYLQNIINQLKEGE